VSFSNGLGDALLGSMGGKEISTVVIGGQPALRLTQRDVAETSKYRDNACSRYLDSYMRCYAGM
jgi:hypothetical protein